MENTIAEQLRAMADTIERLEIKGVLGISDNRVHLSPVQFDSRFSAPDVEERFFCTAFPWEKSVMVDGIKFFAIYTTEEFNNGTHN